MANELQKKASEKTGAITATGTSEKPAPAKKTGAAPSIWNRPAPSPQSLPNASLIYGMAASGLFVMALFFLISGRWFTGLLTLLPACCFMGFALYFLKTR